jgi:extradiol dioxygenase family protein
MLGATMIVATVPLSDLERARTFYGETLGVRQG